MKNRILVIGGTGTIGKSVVNHLNESKEDFTVLVRSKESADELGAKGISTVIGSLGGEKLGVALSDVNTIFLLTSPSPMLFEQHKDLIDQAKAAGVRKIVRLSAEPAETHPEVPMYALHRQSDDYLINSGLEYVILRPSYFMQNFMMHVPFIKENDMFAQYFGETKVAMVDTRDIAAAAYEAIRSDQFNNSINTITGEKAISFSDVAAQLSKELGRNINYVPLSFEDQRAGFLSAGVPEWVTDSSLELIKKWGETPVHKPSSDFKKMTGNAPKSIDDFVNDFAMYFK